MVRRTTELKNKFSLKTTKKNEQKAIKQATETLEKMIFNGNKLKTKKENNFKIQDTRYCFQKTIDVSITLAHGRLKRTKTQYLFLIATDAIKTFTFWLNLVINYDLKTISFI